MIRVSLLDVGGITPEQFQAAAARLSDVRQAKIAAMRFEKDKKLSLGAGLLLDQGLGAYGLRERTVQIACGANGKPYLPEHPGLHFNLSHSGTLAMAVFSDREIGCDVEQKKTASFRVADRFFCPEEQQFVAKGVTSEERTDRFFRIWTLKESFLKVTGEGTHFPLNRFCIHLGEAPARLTVDGRCADYALYEFSLSGYRAAVCAAGDIREAGDEVFFSFQNLQDVV